MKNLAAKAVLFAALTAALPRAGFADSPPVLPVGATGATFDYSISVKTPKGTKSDTGRIAIASAGENRLSLTITPSGGESKTIPLNEQDAR